MPTVVIIQLFAVVLLDYAWFGLITLLGLGIISTFLTAINWRLNVKVNCWFCNFDQVIRRSNVDWWKCLMCEQFNGFDGDGDYSYEIPDMFAERGKQVPVCQSGISQDSSINKKVALCQSCEVRQAKKIEAIANFHPSDEDLFDIEWEQQKLFLDEKFRLCDECNQNVQLALHEQDKMLLGMQCRSNGIIHSKSDLSSPKRGKPASSIKISQSRNLLIGKFVIPLLHLSSLLKACVILKFFCMIPDLALYILGLYYLMMAVLLRLFSRLPWSCLLVSTNWLVIAFVHVNAGQAGRSRFLLLGLLLWEGVFVLYKLVAAYQLRRARKKYLKERQEQLASVRKVSKKTIGKPPGTLSSAATSIAEKPMKGYARVMLRETPPFVAQVIPTASPSPKAFISEEVAQYSPNGTVTPDLLRGHLGGLFIEEKSAQKPFLARPVNHLYGPFRNESVVAHETSPRSVKSLLRPAVFTASATSPKTATHPLWSGHGYPRGPSSIIQSDRLSVATANQITEKPLGMESTHSGSCNDQSDSRSVRSSASSASAWHRRNSLRRDSLSSEDSLCGSDMEEAPKKIVERESFREMTPCRTKIYPDRRTKFSQNFLWGSWPVLAIIGLLLSAALNIYFVASRKI